jgi:hypothetical protein
VGEKRKGTATTEATTSSGAGPSGSGAGAARAGNNTAAAAGSGGVYLARKTADAVGLYKLNPADPYLESAWCQPSSL